MTRIEKETVISALAEYKDKQRRKADRERRRGELGKAIKSNSEYHIAEAMLTEFCKILAEPCGSVRI